MEILENYRLNLVFTVWVLILVNRGTRKLLLNGVDILVKPLTRMYSGFFVPKKSFGH